MLFRLNRTKVNERSGIYQWRPSLRSKRFQSSYCAKVGARTLHSFFFFCTYPNYLDELARKRLLCRLVTSRNLRSRTGALFPFSPLQYASRPVTSRTWLPWRLCRPTRSVASSLQSSYLRPYSHSSSKVNDFAYCGKCLELEPTFKIVWGYWLFLQHYCNKVSSSCSIYCNWLRWFPSLVYVVDVAPSHVLLLVALGSLDCL